MKKHLWIVALVAALAMVFVGCGDGGSDGPDEPTYPEQAEDVVRFIFNDKSYVDIEFEAGATEWSDITSNSKYKPDVWTNNDKAFGFWQDEAGVRWPKTGDNADNTIQAKLLLKAIFWSNLVTNDNTALEKLSLENAGLAIYKFAIPSGSTLGDYKQFEASFKVNEVAYNSIQSRHRVYGEFGTFATHKDTTGAILFDDKDIDGWQEDANGSRILNAPKFNVTPYILINGGRDLWLNAENAIATNVISGTLAPDTWFTLKYELPGSPNEFSSYDATGSLYYGLGQTTNADGRNANTFVVQSPVHAPIIQLIKGVKLVHKSDPSKDVVATIPGATEAQFMANVSPGEINWCWRGAPNATPGVTPPVVKPPEPGEYPPATQDFTPTGTLALAVYQNDSAKDTSDTRKRLTISGNAITFDIQAGDFNNNGAYGGGGFKILFAGLDLPAIQNVSDYRSYKNIILDTTIAGTSMATKEVIFSAIDGANVQTIVNNNAAAAQYVRMVDGANVFKCPVVDLVPAEGKEIGIAVRANNWSEGNVPIIGTITVNSITFTKD
jgi:hypothetical protein